VSFLEKTIILFCKKSLFQNSASVMLLIQRGIRHLGAFCPIAKSIEWRKIKKLFCSFLVFFLLVWNVHFGVSFGARPDGKMAAVYLCVAIFSNFRFAFLHVAIFSGRVLELISSFAKDPLKRALLLLLL